MQKSSIRFSEMARILTVLAILTFFFVSFLQARVDNHDFWWHLAGGRHIVETGALPQEDPFSYTIHKPVSDRQSLILKGYWLAQIIFYEVYRTWDVSGIAVLRSLLMLLFLLFVFLNVKKQGSSDFMALMFTSLMFLVAVPYSADRPQLFTFLIFSIVHYLLEDFRMTTSPRIFFVPLLLAASANMHPGYIVCLLLVSLYVAAFGIDHFITKDRRERRGTFRTLLVIWLLSLLSSMLNPVGWSAFSELAYMGEYTREIIEFMPTFYLFAHKLMPLNYPYIIFLALSLLSLFRFKTIGTLGIIVLVVFSAMSFISIRYLIFYMCVAAPIIAKAVSTFGARRVFIAPPATASAGTRLLRLVFCIAAVVLAFHSLSGLARRDLKAEFIAAAPKDAAAFLKGLPVRGNMLNDYGFGGYLIWTLYPEKKVFIDGRMLDAAVYNEYRAVTLTRQSQAHSWEDILRDYDISYVIVPPLLHQGQIYPLVEKLYDSTEWVLIYNDHTSLIFLRDDPRNISLAKQYALDKKEVLNAIALQASTNARNDLTNPYFLISLAKASIKMGNFDEAEKALLGALERDPGNPEAGRWMQKIRGRR
jgi:hypothetical protein